MISIIISTYQPEYCNQLTKNIALTIGTPYEIVLIENKGKMSICAAYNRGIVKAKYNLLCFIHEDIIFISQNWGSVLVNYFSTIPNLGCVGVAGALNKTKAPSAWWDVPKDQWVAHLEQKTAEGNIRFDNYGWNNNEKYKEVSIIDGVFMASQKSSQIFFDERINGFHCYDLNLSLESKKIGLTNIVTKEIFLKHYSSGTLNLSWVKNTHTIHRLYKDLLPISVSKTSFQIDQELHNLIQFVLKSFQYKSKWIAVLYWYKLLLKKPLSRTHIQLIRSLFIK